MKNATRRRSRYATLGKVVISTTLCTHDLVTSCSADYIDKSFENPIVANNIKRHMASRENSRFVIFYALETNAKIKRMSTLGNNFESSFRINGSFKNLLRISHWQLQILRAVARWIFSLGFAEAISAAVLRVWNPFFPFWDNFFTRIALLLNVHVTVERAFWHFVTMLI